LSFGEISSATELLKRIRAIAAKGYGLITFIIIHSDSEEIAEWLMTMENVLGGIVVANIEADIMKKKITGISI